MCAYLRTGKLAAQNSSYSYSIVMVASAAAYYNYKKSTDYLHKIVFTCMNYEKVCLHVLQECTEVVVVLCAEPCV